MNLVSLPFSDSEAKCPSPTRSSGPMALSWAESYMLDSMILVHFQPYSIPLIL
jgi:hypothetical protein